MAKENSANPTGRPTSRQEKSFGQGSPEISRYAEEVFQPVDRVLAHVRDESVKAGLPMIQVGAMDGLHLEILTRILAPRKVVEIGTLGGYSAICMARGMTAGGELHSFEKSELHAQVARKNIEWATAQGEFREIEFHLHLGSALDELPKIQNRGPFDLVFIDADKPSYVPYLEWAADNLRVGGVVLGDNTFAWGQVHRAQELTGNDKKMVGSLDQFNRALAAHPEFRSTVFPTAEGLTVGVKTEGRGELSGDV